MRDATQRPTEPGWYVTVVVVGEGPDLVEVVKEADGELWVHFEGRRSAVECHRNVAARWWLASELPSEVCF